MEQRKIPSNIMFKSAYSLENEVEPWKEDTIKELYNYIFSFCKPEELPYIELEAKLGFFAFNKGAKVFQNIKDIFKLPNYQNNKGWSTNFNSFISKEAFYTLWMVTERELKRPDSGVVRKDPLNINETFFKSGKRLSVVKNAEGKLLEEKVILKTDKQHSNIRNNGQDFRITVCKEIPSETANSDEKIFERNKYRLSYEFRFFSLDLTIVGQEGEEKYEAEFEMVKLKEFVEQGVDFQQFSYLMRRYLENVVLFYKVIGENYFNYLYPSEQNSTFGDYMKSFNLIK